TTVAPAATARRLFCQSRHGRNSRARSRRTPAMCAARSSTSTTSASLTAGWSDQRRKLSSFASPASALPSAQKWSGRKSASATPETRWTAKAHQAGWLRARKSFFITSISPPLWPSLADEDGEDGPKTPHRQHQPRDRNRDVQPPPAPVERFRQ